MDHRRRRCRRSVVCFIHPRRSSFIQTTLSNELNSTGEVVILFLLGLLVLLSTTLTLTSFLFFRYFCFAMRRFLQDFSASSTITSPWLTQQIAHWKQRTVFFFLFSSPSLSYYFTPAYIITSLAHRRFGIFLSNMTCGCGDGKLTRISNYFGVLLLTFFFLLLVFPISATLPIHFTDWITARRRRRRR